MRSCKSLFDAGVSLSDQIEIINFYGASSLTRLPKRLPANLKRLMLNHCTQLTALPELPAGLQRLDLDDASAIVEIDGLPEGLEELSANRCGSLKKIGRLPASLTSLCIRDSQAARGIARVAAQVEDLFITNSGLKSLPELPASVNLLDINGVEHLLAGKKRRKVCSR